jgi:hypothetical protein
MPTPSLVHLLRMNPPPQWAIGHLGRHNTMAGCMVLGGAACTACAFVPPGDTRIALASVGKFGVSGAFAIASVLTGELHPTLIRSAVLGAMNQAARIGAVAAPFVAMAGGGGVPDGAAARVPFLTFGVASLGAAALISTLPETNGMPLPDTMADMGAIASIFTNGTLAKKGLRAAAASMFKSHARLPGGGGGGGARQARQGGRGREEGPRQGAYSIWEEDEAAPPDEAGEAEAGGGDGGSGARSAAKGPPPVVVVAVTAAPE